MSRPDCVISAFPTKTLPKAFQQLVLNKWNAHCVGVSRNTGNTYGVSASYGKHALAASDYVIIAHTPKRLSLCGFLLLQHKRSLKMGYIDVLCSGSKYGGDLLQFAERFCKNELRCEFMKLSALSEIIWWYEKKGFQHVDFPCHPNRIPKRKPVRIPGYRSGSHVDNFSGQYDAGDGWRMTKCLGASVSKKRGRNINNNYNNSISLKSSKYSNSNSQISL
jgi:hypothetical protein